MESVEAFSPAMSDSAPSLDVVLVTQPPPAQDTDDSVIVVSSALSPPLVEVEVPSSLTSTHVTDGLAPESVEVVPATLTIGQDDDGAEEASPIFIADSMPESAHPPAQFHPPLAASPLALLGDASQDLLLSPQTLQQEEKEGEDLDAVRGDALQDKYSATSAWVGSLPPAPTDSAAVALLDDATAMTVATATQERKRRRGTESGKSHASKPAVGERQRRAQEKAAAAELQTAFKHSQRALRKQAKSVNMRDVFSRTLSLPSPLHAATEGLGGSFSSTTPPPNAPLADEASTSVTAPPRVSPPPSLRFGTPLFSPSSLVSPSSPSSSSAWSPGMVGELTNRFLANVQQHKRQRFEQMVSRELTQSQALSQTRSLPPPHAQPHGDDTAAGRDELVIGEEDNEAANWMPAEPASPTSQHARRMGHRETGAHDELVLLGASSSEEGQVHSFPTTPVDWRRGEQVMDEKDASQHQEQVVKSLARKHEIWKLRQRQLKAQEQVESDERAKALQQQQQQQAHEKSAKTALGAPLKSTPADATRSGVESTTTTATGTAGTGPLFAGLLRTSQVSVAGHRPGGAQDGVAHTSVPRTLTSAKLSADDISMIRRINSFDNTSAQRVVVFGTAASKQAKDDAASR